MGTEPWNRPRQTNRQTERWSWARLLSASLLVPQSEAGTEPDQPFQIPKHLTHTKMSSHPFLVPKIRGAEYSCTVPGSLVTGSASRIGCVIRTFSMVSFAQWAHTRSIELSSFCSPPLQESSFSFSFSGALTNQLRVGGILRGVDQGHWIPMACWNSMVCPVNFRLQRLAVPEWGCYVLQGHEAPTPHFSEYSLNIHTAPSDC